MGVQAGYEAYPRDLILRSLVHMSSSGSTGRLYKRTEQNSKHMRSSKGNVKVEVQKSAGPCKCLLHPVLPTSIPTRVLES
jgi:hypothetical protein